MYFDLIVIFVSFLMLLSYVIIIIIAHNGLINPSNVCDELVVEQNIFVNVIIVFNNEALNLPRLINSIHLQNYKNYRIIWVDDNTIDNSVSIIENSELINKSVIIRQKQPDNGKKSGIKKAVEIADGELLIFTDADCFMNPDWITTYVAKYQKNGDGLYFGAVQYSFSGFLQKLFALEFSSLVGIGLGLANKNLPVYFNAANYAFSSSIKSAISNCPNQDYASGDDVFLLHYLKKKYHANNINVIMDLSAIVHTVAPRFFGQFVKQRIRWGGKTKGYNDFFTVYIAVNVFVLSFLQIALLFYSHVFVVMLVIWSMKIGIDILFLVKVKSVFNNLPSVGYSLIISPFYPFYIVFAGLVGVFVSKSKWLK